MLLNMLLNMLLTKNGGANQVGATNVPGLVNSSESEDTSSDEDPKINYVNNAKYKIRIRIKVMGKLRNILRKCKTQDASNCRVPS